MTTVSPHVRALLAQHPWDETIKRLLYYTLYQVRARTWRGIRGGSMPGGREAEDIVSQAVEDILAGRRAWDPARYPDLFVYLRSIVDSKLSHLGTSAENWRMLAAFPPLENGYPWTTGGRKQPCDSAASPPEVLIQAEEERLAEALLQGFANSLVEEPLLQGIVRCILDGIDKPAAIASRVGVTIERVYSARRRLQRKWHAYRMAHDQAPLSSGEGTGDG
jgi:hypothetical protein